LSSRTTLLVVLVVVVALAAATYPAHALAHTSSTTPARLSSSSSPEAEARSSSSAPAHWFGVEDDQFVLDGEPLTLVACSVHYFRLLHEQWLDRLSRVRALGCNAVQTYVAWNYHCSEAASPDVSACRFDGDRNLTAFLRTAESVGLQVVLRLGPFIDAEWEWGGLPAYLIASSPGTTVRTASAAYMAAAGPFFQHVLRTIVAPALWPGTPGALGPVVAVQVENEYGFFGDVVHHAADAAYVEALVGWVRQALGPDVLIWTTDGPNNLLKGGTNEADPNTLRTPDFGPWQDAQKGHDSSRKFNPKGKGVFWDSELHPGQRLKWGDAAPANMSAVALAQMVTDIIKLNGRYDAAWCTEWHCMHLACACGFTFLSLSLTILFAPLLALFRGMRCACDVRPVCRSTWARAAQIMGIGTAQVRHWRRCVHTHRTPFTFAFAQAPVLHFAFRLRGHPPPSLLLNCCVALVMCECRVQLRTDLLPALP
jgi:hypothetical protein